MLNPKQEAFCLHYAETGNAAESYKRAGYSPRNDNVAGANARRLLQNAKIQARLQELAAEIESSKIANIKEIQEYLTSVMRREKKESVVVTLTTKTEKWVMDEDTGKLKKQTITEESPMVVEIPAKLSDANKAAETLAKMQGGFDSKLQMEIITPVFGGESELED